MRAVHAAVLVVLAGCLVPRGACAQSAAPSNVAAPTVSTAPPWGMFAVRYDTRTSNFIYAVYGHGRTFGMVGVLDNPRSGFDEVLGAAGRTIPISGLTQFVAMGAALEDGLWYAQLYFLPTAHAGPLWIRATSEWDAPISSGGALQFSLSPASATVPLGDLVQAGVGVDLAAARGSKSNIDVGPELRFALPKATLILDAQRALDLSRSRLRVSFTAAF